MENENSNEIDVIKEVKNWDELELKEDILRGIYAHGFETPSQIQKTAISLEFSFSMIKYY